MPTLTEIANRNGIALDHLRDLDACGRLPEPVGANSDGRLFDERTVLQIVRPARSGETVQKIAPSEKHLGDEWMQGVWAAIAFLSSFKTKRARLARLAAGEFVLANQTREKNGEALETIAHAARRFGIERETFSRAISELQRITPR